MLALRRPVAPARRARAVVRHLRPPGRARSRRWRRPTRQSGRTRGRRAVVDAIRPITSALAPTIMPILDAPYQRGGATPSTSTPPGGRQRRAHAMVYGYLAGGATRAVAALGRRVQRRRAAPRRPPRRRPQRHGHADHHPRPRGAAPVLRHVVRGPADVPRRRRGGDGEGGEEARLLHGALAAHDLDLRGRARGAPGRRQVPSALRVARPCPPQGGARRAIFAQFCAILARNSRPPLAPPIPHPRSPFPSLQVLDRAKAVGFTSLALTADFSWVGNRERETKTGFTVPPSYSVRQCIDAIKSPAWTYDYMSRVPYGYKVRDPPPAPAPPPIPCTPAAPPPPASHRRPLPLPPGGAGRRLPRRVARRLHRRADEAGVRLEGRRVVRRLPPLPSPPFPLLRHLPSARPPPTAPVPSSLLSLTPGSPLPPAGCARSGATPAPSPSRASRRARTPSGRWRPASAPCGSPTTAAASSRTRSRPSTSCPRCARPSAPTSR